MERSLSDRSRTVYVIKVRGHLCSDWADWLGELEIVYNVDTSITTLTGPLIDQSALHGVLSQLHTLNLELVSVMQLWSE